MEGPILPARHAQRAATVPIRSSVDHALKQQRQVVARSCPVPFLPRLRRGLMTDSRYAIIIQGNATTQAVVLDRFELEGLAGDAGAARDSST